ncbi:putative protein-lysine deacylase ABHD14B [Saccoglossus kowalevskii]|uniref:Alpha/beta hydrolase domain-containing protein 14B-like n=1 Tax=Saccoglossus kowalevskii TaxID=10224 RepID=A0ABM0H147_SACKO|nr:PREDICTED: alpha/beta hydrolase domain-containing protein 14B-like [Saccoglossus kowalevskii]
MAGQSDSWRTCPLKEVPKELCFNIEEPDPNYEILKIKIKVEGATGDVFYQEISDKNKKDQLNGSVLLLHGKRFTSQNWFDIGTLQHMIRFGYRAVAVDLPGYGLSKDVELTVDKGEFLLNIIKALKLEHSVIVSPSMSGTFALPLLMKHPEVFRGYVPVAPVETELYSADQYGKIQVPTFIVYGEHDTDFGQKSMNNLKNLPNSRIYVIEGAGHPAWLDQPITWHNLMYNFLVHIPK